MNKVGRSTRGAVYVEFLIAFMPLFCFFLTLVQFSVLQIVNIITKHAAEQTVRAAIVIIHDDPQYYNGEPVGLVAGKRREEIERAAKIMLGGTEGNINVILNPSYDRDEMVTLRLELEFPCTVPFGRLVICGAGTTPSKPYGERADWSDSGQEVRMLHGTASLPNQGADYTY